MNNKQRNNWRFFFIIGGILFGFFLGSILVYVFKGYFPYEVLLGSFVGAGILAIIELVKQKRKK